MRELIIIYFYKRLELIRKETQPKGIPFVFRRNIDPCSSNKWNEQIEHFKY
jgi:hypothetical protein